MGVEYGFEIVKLLIAVDVARSLVKYVKQEQVKQITIGVRLVVYSCLRKANYLLTAGWESLILSDIALGHLD